MKTSTIPVTDKLENPDKNVRIRAALDIGALGDPAALPALTAQLVREPGFFVRENLTWAIACMGEAAVPAMLDLLRSGGPSTRLQAAHTLSKLGDPRAVAALVAALQDDDLPVVQKAAFALGQLGDARALPALVCLLGSGNAELQTTVTRALEGFGATALPTLAKTLDHQDWEVREQGVDLMGFTGDPAAVPWLARALRDGHGQVRFAAATALGSLQDPGAREALRSALEDGDRRVRLVATRALRTA